MTSPTHAAQKQFRKIRRNPETTFRALVEHDGSGPRDPHGTIDQDLGCWTDKPLRQIFDLLHDDRGRPLEGYRLVAVTTEIPGCCPIEWRDNRLSWLQQDMRQRFDAETHLWIAEKRKKYPIVNLGGDTPVFY